jgi:hypothetical protein
MTSIKEEEISKLLRIEEELHKRIISQEKAISALARAIRRSRAGLKSPKRPAGSFLFLGPTGVGKTEVARALAEFLFGSDPVRSAVWDRKLGEGDLGRAGPSRLAADWQSALAVAEFLPLEAARGARATDIPDNRLNHLTSRRIVVW